MSWSLALIVYSRIVYSRLGLTNSDVLQLGGPGRQGGSGGGGGAPGPGGYCGNGGAAGDEGKLLIKDGGLLINDINGTITVNATGELSIAHSAASLINNGSITVNATLFNLVNIINNSNLAIGSPF